MISKIYTLHNLFLDAAAALMENLSLIRNLCSHPFIPQTWEVFKIPDLQQSNYAGNLTATKTSGFGLFIWKTNSNQHA